MIGSFRELGGATVIITPATQRGGEGGLFSAAEKTRSSKLHPPKKNASIATIESPPSGCLTAWSAAGQEGIARGDKAHRVHRPALPSGHLRP